jgi:hypothetical protein
MASSSVGFNSIAVLNRWIASAYLFFSLNSNKPASTASLADLGLSTLVTVSWDKELILKLTHRDDFGMLLEQSEK